MSEDGSGDVVVTREIDAPPAVAWQAWSDSDLIRQWWGPTGFTCPRAEVDFRVGGTTLVAMQAPREHGAFRMHNRWTYRSIAEPTRIEFVSEFADSLGRAVEPAEAGIPHGVPAQVPHVVELEPLPGGRTRVTVRETGYTDEAARQQSRAGQEQCMDKMQASLAAWRTSGRYPPSASTAGTA
ncbi:SRPBCC family protein [Blastococcus xanthinilyticus]|uniref:Uncharacterized protein YndB with AHSA1/START domain n=1 Tax=Blastococcus xanthinilyticus TaxID=1564164 RepID=A0A5S5CV14_9ACTN|nr:SRPBCC domain-containing protein [Blastococcus xanthinilyticus]TYP87617.1 uncharacterized protein YndB with AHSA1/START domain [Blastococcus xanthinilyticus]